MIVQYVLENGDQLLLNVDLTDELQLISNHHENESELMNNGILHMSKSFLNQRFVLNVVNVVNSIHSTCDEF